MPVVVTNRDLYNLLTNVLAKVNTLAIEAGNLIGKVNHMSQTIPQQIDAVTAALQAEMQDIASKIDAVIAGMSAGTPVTQAQVDALTAVSTGLQAVQAKVDAAVAPPATP